MDESTRAKVVAYATAKSLTFDAALDELLSAGLDRKRAQASGGQTRWARLTPAERSEMGRAMLAAREAKKHGK